MKKLKLLQKRKQADPLGFPLVRVSRADVKHTPFNISTRAACEAIFFGGERDWDKAAADQGIAASTVRNAVLTIYQVAVEESRRRGAPCLQPSPTDKYHYHPMRRMAPADFADTFKRISPGCSHENPLFKAAERVLCHHAYIDYAAERHFITIDKLETVVRRIEQQKENPMPTPEELSRKAKEERNRIKPTVEDLERHKDLFSERSYNALRSMIERGSTQLQAGEFHGVDRTTMSSVVAGLKDAIIRHNLDAPKPVIRAEDYMAERSLPKMSKLDFLSVLMDVLPGSDSQSPACTAARYVLCNHIDVKAAADDVKAVQGKVEYIIGKMEPAWREELDRREGDAMKEFE